MESSSRNEDGNLRLCDFLQQARDEILAAWERAVRDGSVGGMRSVAQQPQEDLRDLIPALLARIADVVRAMRTGAPASLGDLPDLHALHRLEAGYRLRSAMRELSLLRVVAIDLWRARVSDRQPQLVLEEVRRFDAAIDEVIVRSVERYVSARERTAESLERLSAAALGTGDIDGYLPRLLDAVLETTEAVDTVAVFVADGDTLRVRAATGLGAERARNYTVRVGRGFAGRIAAERKPQLVLADEIDPQVHNPGVRGMGLRALYGVPLEHGGEAVGVAYMGSTTAEDFSEVDKRLFRIMSQRATTIIVEGQLVARERAALRERQRALDALEVRESELAQFFGISPDMLVVAGADGFLKRINPAFSSVLGYSEAELLSTPYLELIHPDDRERTREEVKRVLAGHPAVRFTFRVTRRDGEVRWVAFNGAAEEDGQLFAAVGRDITEERQLQELEQQLIGIVSHDLRGPLSTIVISCNTLLRRAHGLDADTLESVRRIQSAADRAVALIHDLLDFTTARIPGGIAISPQRIDLHSLARTAAEEVHADFPDRELKHEQRGAGEGVWDPARLEQIVSNLVSNAFKYGAPGTPVVLRTRGERGSVRLEVHNEGEPIDAGLLPHIFEPLRRGRRAGGGSSVAGVGLGLYIVERIVKAHGGTIRVASTREGGTTFTVRLRREPPKRA